MSGKVNYALVGLFVLLLGSGLAATVLWLSVGGSDKHYDLYLAYFKESVSGLNPNASVKYRGVDVGRVKEIALDRDNPEQVRLLLEIEEGTPVKVDSVAILSTQGITGLVYVDLSGGSRESPLLTASPGRRYPEIRTGPSLLLRLDNAITTALTQIAQVAEGFQLIATRLDRLLNDDNQAAFGATLRHIEAVTAGVAEERATLETSLQAVNRMLAHGAEASAQLPEVMGQVGRSLKAVEEAVTRGQGELNRLSRDTLAPLGPLLQELQRLAQSLNRLAGELERKPNLLLLGRPKGAPGPGE